MKSRNKNTGVKAALTELTKKVKEMTAEIRRKSETVATRADELHKQSHKTCEKAHDTNTSK
jgi:hypothetical protein